MSKPAPGLRQLEQRSIEFRSLGTNHGQDVTARPTSGPPGRQDLADLAQGEAQVARLADEPKGFLHLAVVDPVTGRRSAGRRQQTFVLVAPDRPPTEAASLRQFPDGHGRLHDGKPSR